ncbi:molybdopterin-binding protein [Aurantimonas marianensis]|uniref:Molybdopterin molybdenumtransferase n=1 Tax=Aurantimonas marianensis TaxID=2920428 RepID=A0A9X2KD88_9HYPH|nr:molybdopterin-binding protein [Aurantimonas marianensis]MCP3054143.1 molybdopterin-binding protein [Aurantimonas marianensis]
MTALQEIGGALAAFDVVHDWLLDGLAPVAPVDLPLDAVLGAIAAEPEPASHACPSWDEAAIDGWALAARDLIGASSFAPAVPAVPPVRVEVGDILPDGCDCVVDLHGVDAQGPLIQVLTEAIPGQGVRRAGEDIAVGQLPAIPGRRISAFDLLCARRGGLMDLPVRRPLVRLIDLESAHAARLTADFAAARAGAAGAVVARVSCKRDAASIASNILAEAADLIVLVGGTGAGRNDQTAAAIAQAGERFAHGIALQPGRTAAFGRVGQIPVIALPGQPDQALAVWLTLVEPILLVLTGARPRDPVSLPLARKISSGIGVTDIVLLKQTERAWTPLTVGALSPAQLVSADAWCLIPAMSEGHAAGTPVAGYSLHEAP